MTDEVPDLGEPFKCTLKTPYTPDVTKTHRLILHPEARPMNEQFSDIPNSEKIIRCPICGYSWEKGR